MNTLQGNILNTTAYRRAFYYLTIIEKILSLGKNTWNYAVINIFLCFTILYCWHFLNQLHEGASPRRFS